MPLCIYCWGSQMQFSNLIPFSQFFCEYLYTCIIYWFGCDEKYTRSIYKVSWYGSQTPKSFQNKSRIAEQKRKLQHFSTANLTSLTTVKLAMHLQTHIQSLQNKSRITEQKRKHWSCKSSLTNSVFFYNFQSPGSCPTWWRAPAGHSVKSVTSWIWKLKDVVTIIMC